MSSFKDLYKIDVSKDVKVLGWNKLNYLSWATAYKLMMEQDENATYEVLTNENGFPVFSELDMYFVKTAVTMNNVTKSMLLPVMDRNNYSCRLEEYEMKTKNSTKTVERIDSRKVNDAIQRCLAKNIALFGIGLKLYTGEDLTQYEEDKASQEQIIKIVQLTNGNMELQQKIKTTYKVNNFVDLTEKQATQTIKRLETNKITESPNGK